MCRYYRYFKCDIHQFIFLEHNYQNGLKLILFHIFGQVFFLMVIIHVVSGKLQLNTMYNIIGYQSRAFKTIPVYPSLYTTRMQHLSKVIRNVGFVYYMTKIIQNIETSFKYPIAHLQIRFNVTKVTSVSDKSRLFLHNQCKIIKSNLYPFPYTHIYISQSFRKHRIQS